MIEIIKHGNALNYTTCPKCGCQFMFNKDEIGSRIDESDKMTIKLFVFCPECDNIIDMEE